MAIDYYLRMIDPLYSLSGFAVGLLVGTTGVGGGSLMTPLLILLFGTHPATAVGTDLLYAAATKTGGSLVHGLARNVEWPVVRRLATGSVPATMVTLIILSFMSLESQVARSLITLVLCGALLMTAGVLIFRRTIVRFYRNQVPSLDDRSTAIVTVTVGAILGVVVAISSVGAGAIGVIALIILYPRLPMARIVGSDIAHAVPLTLIAGAGHWIIGTIDWHIFSSLLAGSLPGIILGSYLAFRIPEPALRQLLAATLMVVASKLLYDHLEISSSMFTAFTRQAPH
jgi:uncharacterized membrane protein YfcA